MSTIEWRNLTNDQKKGVAEKLSKEFPDEWESMTKDLQMFREAFNTEVIKFRITGQGDKGDN